MALDAQTRDMLKGAIGMTDADLDRLGPNIQAILAHFEDFTKYKFVAECTESQYCFAGIKQGQKYVFNTAPPIILPETDCPTCLRALAPITSIVNTMMERIASGMDPTPVVFQVAECLDPGVDRGGLGHVVFKVYAQKA
ncbi:MAG: hypothetical protein V3U31_02420 [Dehalococcoidia bacterium]